MCEYEYDTAGNKIKSTFYDNGNGKITTWSEYEYDSNGKEKKITTHDKYGSVDWVEHGAEYEYEYEYDADGNMVKEVCYRCGTYSKDKYTETEYTTIYVKE